MALKMTVMSSGVTIQDAYIKITRASIDNVKKSGSCFVEVFGKQGEVEPLPTKLEKSFHISGFEESLALTDFYEEIKTHPDYQDAIDC